MFPGQMGKVVEGIAYKKDRVTKHPGLRENIGDMIGLDHRL